jgi:hypothetical protein
LPTKAVPHQQSGELHSRDTHHGPARPSLGLQCHGPGQKPIAIEGLNTGTGIIKMI